MRRFTDLDRLHDQVLITNDLGEFVIAHASVKRLLQDGLLSPRHARFADLEARGLLHAEGPQGGLAAIAKRTRKAFLREGPSLHIFVVTLRCDHSCQYCQVSRAALNASGKDMSRDHARAAIDRVMESDAPALTVEFQGGEPSLRFDLVREIVEEIELRRSHTQRPIRFTMATTLHLLNVGDLEFCRDHDIHLSTSLDGPEHIDLSGKLSKVL